MAIEPGQSVPSGCNHVWKFPFSMLKGPTNLQLDTLEPIEHVDRPPSIYFPLRGSLPLAEYKQEYIDLFKKPDHGLTVCDKDNFAKINTPLRCKLSAVDIFGIIYFGSGVYTVVAYGPPRIYQASNGYSAGWKQPPPITSSWSGVGLSGNVTFDVANGPIQSFYSEQTGLCGFFYENKTFECSIKVSYVLEGTGDVSYFGFPLYMIHGKLEATLVDDGGSATFTAENSSLSPSTAPGTAVGLSESVYTNIIGDTGEPGTLKKTLNMSIKVGSTYPSQD